MQPRLLLFLFLISYASGSDSADLVDTLYGISLGEHLDLLEGEKHRQTGIVKIKGIKHQMYLLDTSIYKLDPPLERLLVQVEIDTLKVKGVMAMAEMSIEECKKHSTELKRKMETIIGISFKEFQHQGDIFYIHEAKDTFMSIGCQNKKDTVLQYQIGTSS